MFMYESFFGRLMTRVFDLISLNLLFIVTSLPIFTIGASLTALHATTLKMVQKKEQSVYRYYFKTFKENFKQSSLFWVILITIGLILVGNLKLISNSATLKYLVPLTYFFLLLIVICLVYVFPLMGQFKTNHFVLIKNTLLIAIGFFPYTILFILISFGPLFSAMFLNSWTYGVAIYFYIFIGVALTSYLNGMLFNRIVKKLVINQELSSMEAES